MLTKVYVHGQHPHPTRDRAGHSSGTRPLNRTRPRSVGGLPNLSVRHRPLQSRVLLGSARGWHACGRSGRMADFLKALIALTAAGVKLREGRERGVRQHAGAQALFDQMTWELGAADTPTWAWSPRCSLVTRASWPAPVPCLRPVKRRSYPSCSYPQPHDAGVIRNLGQ